MENSPHNTIMLHDKLANSDTLLLLCGVILFSDLFLSVNYQVSLYTVNFEWYKNNLSIRNTIAYIFVFSFFYGAFIPFILWSIDNFLSVIISKKTPIFSHQIKLDDLKKNAITENNSAAYKYFESRASKLEKLESRRRLCLGLVLLTITILIRSMFSENHENILDGIIYTILSDGMLSGITRLAILIFTIWILINILNTTDHFTNTEFISNYESRLDSKWISEVSSGLLEKTSLFEHLDNINECSNLYTEESKYDYKNPSHNFCKTHGLIKIENESIKFTEKGNFFKKYASSHK